MLLLVAVCSPVLAAPAARILPLGDSLTLGAQGSGGGYRTPLGEALKGYTSPYNAGFVGGLYWHGDHSGYSGHTLGGILAAVKAARTMELNSPTHVLLMGGTNDAYFFPPLGANATTMLSRLHTLLEFLLDRPAPPIVLLATPPPVLIERCAVYSQGPCAPTVNANIEAYNRGLPEVIASFASIASRTAAAGSTPNPVRLVNMTAAGFTPEDYWVAGIHFNDNGWCKMARVWAQALMPTLPKRSAMRAPTKQSATATAAAAAMAAFAESAVADTPGCAIPGATEAAAVPADVPDADAAGGAAVSLNASSDPAVKVRSLRCDVTVTVNATGAAADEPPFSAFYGDVAAALGLQFGPRGAFCAWTPLVPRQFNLAPWTSHGVTDTAGSVPSPSGPLFQMFQTLGTTLLRATVAPDTAHVPLALATIRQWATQTTVSVLVNATTGGGQVCLAITGLSPTVVTSRCGGHRHDQQAQRGRGLAAATVVELDSTHGVVINRTTTRMAPCVDSGRAEGTAAVFALRASQEGVLSAVSFAIQHM